MENALQWKSDSTLQSVTEHWMASTSALTSLLEMKGTGAGGHHSLQHLLCNLGSTEHEPVQDAVITDTQNSISDKSVHRSADVSFLAMLSGMPSLLQSYSQDVRNSKPDTCVAKIAIDGSNFLANAFGNETLGNLSELSPHVATNGSLSTRGFPKVLSAASCSSSSSYLEAMQAKNLNCHSSDITGLLTNHLIPADGKVVNFLKGESGHTGQANSGKIHMFNTQNFQKLPLEADIQSVHLPSVASLNGFPRVFCCGTSGNLLLSKPGILGIICSCHFLHMSVSKFCEHSGLISHNPGYAVHMASGDTIGQWRELYFKAMGLRVPDDQNGWDWPEGFPTAAGFVNSSCISSEMQKNASISHLVGSHRGSTKPQEHSNITMLPNNLNLAMNFIIDGSQNKLHESDYGSHIKESAPSLFNCHPLQDNHVTFVPCSRSLTMSKFIAPGPNNDIKASPCYIGSTTKGGNLSIPDSTLQTSKHIGLGFDFRKVEMAKDSTSVDRKVASSHVELKLVQPCQQTWVLGNSAQPIMEPTHFFSGVVTPLKPVTSVDATDGKEPGKYFQPYAGSSYLKGKETPLNIRNHPYGISTAAEPKQATVGTDISKVSAVSPLAFSDAISAENVRVGDFDNRISGCMRIKKPRSYSSTVNYDSVSDPLIFGCNLEKQKCFSDMSFHRAFDKGVGVHSSIETTCLTCKLGPPRTVVDGKNYCRQEKFKVQESGHKQSVSGNMSKSIDFELTPQLQPPLLGFHSGTSSCALDKVLDLSKQDRYSHFPVDNVRVPLVGQISKLQQQAISDVIGCGCQQPSSSSNFRIQCSPVKPQITANMGHCQFPIGQQHSDAGFNSVAVGAMNRICRVPLNGQTEMQSQCHLDLHQSEQTLARIFRSEKEVLVAETEKCTCELPSTDCSANLGGTSGTDCLLGGSVVGTERISQEQLVMEGREGSQFKSICSNNLDSSKEITEPITSNAMLEGKFTSNGLCHFAHWKDVPEKGERRNNASLLDHTRCLQDRREDNRMQLDDTPADTPAESIDGSMEVLHASGEQDGSNLSSGCCSAAVTQTSAGIKKISSPSSDSQNIGGSHNLPVDEGSVIGECCSSYDASESKRSSEFMENGCGTKPRKMCCRFIGSNSHCCLLDDLKLINSLTWKKGQKRVHKEHFYLKGAKCSDVLEQSSKKGRKRRMKIVNSPIHSIVGNSRGNGQFSHSIRCTGVCQGKIIDNCSAKQCSSSLKDACWLSSSDDEALGACADCFHKVSSKLINSSKSLLRKRSLQQLYSDTGESEKKLNWMKDGEHYCDGLVNTGLKKSGGKHPSHRTYELTHADTSVLSAASALRMEVHRPKMRPVASGLYGEISSGEPDPDMLKPAKIVCLSKILKTARRCKVPKDTQSFISGLNRSTLGIYAAIDMQSDSPNGENQATCIIGDDSTFKLEGLDAETEGICFQEYKNTKRYRRGSGICSDLHSRSKFKRVCVRSLNELSLQENAKEILKNPDRRRSRVGEKCENIADKCYAEPMFGLHKGAMACVLKSEFTCAKTEGYKGRKLDGSRHDVQNCPNGEIRSLVSQDQLNAWIYITGQKSRVKSTIKLSRLDVESDLRKEYARYKQGRGWKHLVVYKSGIHALGLYTSQFIYHGEMVVEYVGEIVGQRVADKREKEYQSGKRVQYKSACYFFRIDKEHIIDATRKGGIARFVNHSCQPNCVAKVISLKNEKKVVFFAERDIFPGEEITYDYHFNHEDEGKKIPCYCNAKNCRRFMN